MRVNPRRREAVISLRRQGHSCRAIALQLRTAVSNVHRYLRDTDNLPGMPEYVTGLDDRLHLARKPR